MKELKLRTGQTVLLSDEDYPEISKYNWCMVSIGYAGRYERINGKQRPIIMHRVILPCPVGMIVDHIDGNKLNNTRENLRVCTIKQNAANRKAHKHNKTGYRGVKYTPKDSPKTPYLAVISADGKHRNLGRYATAEEAAKAYDVAAREIYGEYYSRPNIQD